MHMYISLLILLLPIPCLACTYGEHEHNRRSGEGVLVEKKLKTEYLRAVHMMHYIVASLLL